MVSKVLGTMISSVLRATLALLLLVTLLPAVLMVRSAAAKQPVVNLNANADVTAKGNEPSNVNAASPAVTEAQAKELTTAVGGFWKLAWEKSWPAIKVTAIKYWTKLGGIWKTMTSVFNEIGGSVKVNGNANLSGVDLVNVNGSIEVK